MLDRVRNSLGIDTNEWPRVLRISLLFFLMTTGIEFGRIGRDSYFLVNMGADQIPNMYLIIALALFITAFIYGKVLDRFSRDGFQVFIYSVGMVALLSIWYLTTYEPKRFSLLPIIIFCGIETFIVFQLMHFWNFTNSVFDVWEGKRVFPYLGGAGLFGTIIGGAGTRLVAGSFGANALFMCWVIVMFLGILVARSVGKSARVSGYLTSERMLEHRRLEDEHKGIGVFFKALWRQKLLRTLSYMALPIWILIYVIEFNYYSTMKEVFTNQDELAKFLGLFVSISSCFGFIFQFTLTPWLLRKQGVGSTSMIYPFSLTLGMVLLLIYSLFPYPDGVRPELLGFVLLVVIARFCDVAIYYSIFESSSQLLYYAVPDWLRGKGQAFVSGIIQPISTASAGGLLLLFTVLAEPVHNVTFMGLTLGILLVILGLNLTPEYLMALLENIKPDDTEHRNEVLQEIGRLEGSDTRYVMLSSVTAKDPEEALFAVNSLFENRKEFGDDELIFDLHEVADEIHPLVKLSIEEHLTESDRLRHEYKRGSAVDKPKKSKASAYKFIVIVFVLIVAGMSWLGWHTYNSYQITNRIIDRDSQMIRLQGDIRRLDEILTLLSRVAVKTGDLKYVDRYDELFKKLDAAIVHAMKLAPAHIKKAVAEKTDTANRKMLDMEKRALDLVREANKEDTPDKLRQERREAAESIVFSKEYDKQKKDYAEGMNILNIYLDRIGSKTQKEQKRAQFLMFFLGGVMLLLVIGLGFIFRYQVNTHNQLAESYEQLDSLFNKLQTAQTQLVQSEKMAALGQLVAGVAHEVNTPLGAIGASISNISNSLKSIVETWPRILVELPVERRTLFFKMIDRALAKRDYATSKEERKYKRKLTEELEENSVSNSDNIADTLVDMGIYDDIGSFLPLLKEDDSEIVMDMGYNLASQHKNSQNIMTAVERAGKVVFALKSYTHQDHSGEMQFSDLVRGVDTVLTLYESKFKGGVTLDTDYEEIPRVLCFADELNQVWTNLVHNGLQAMDFKGHMEVSVRKIDDNVKIVIIDSGKGIPENIQEQIFEPFFTTKATGEGSGLGLDIVRKIIEKHKGSITFDSKPGRTAFTVILPAEVRQAEERRGA